MNKIERFSAAEAREHLPKLAELLQDIVNGGASVGFIPPLTFERAEAYWLQSVAEVAEGVRLLLVASDGEEIAGTVQLALCAKENGLHRAEVQKLLVHTRFRGRGIARSLMSAVEVLAAKAGRTLLVLDTEQGSVAESLYERCGYTRSGVIPNFALSAEGDLITTVVFYKLLSTSDTP